MTNFEYGQPVTTPDKSANKKPSLQSPLFCRAPPANKNNGLWGREWSVNGRRTRADKGKMMLGSGN